MGAPWRRAALLALLVAGVEEQPTWAVGPELETQGDAGDVPTAGDIWQFAAVDASTLGTVAANFPVAPTDAAKRGPWASRLKVSSIDALYRGVGSLLTVRGVKEVGEPLKTNADKFKECLSMTLGECLDREQQRGAHKLAEPDVRAKLDDKRGAPAVGLIWSTRFVLLCAEMINLVLEGHGMNRAAIAAQRKWLTPGFDDTWQGKMVERLVEEGIKKGVTDERADDLGTKEEMKSFVDKVLPYARAIKAAMREYRLDDSRLGADEDATPDASTGGGGFMMLLIIIVAAVTACTQRGRRTATKGCGWAKKKYAWAKQRMLARNDALELPLSGGGEEPEPPPAAEPDDAASLASRPSSCRLSQRGEEPRERSSPGCTREVCA